MRPTIAKKEMIIRLGIAVLLGVAWAVFCARAFQRREGIRGALVLRGSFLICLLTFGLPVIGNWTVQ
ncbi:hypothetical protein D1231_02325 [Henriciella mobilis]|nr:hypothetical protein D1231_02325 [Henriciella mobilis]